MNDENADNLVTLVAYLVTLVVVVALVYFSVSLTTGW